MPVTRRSGYPPPAGRPRRPARAAGFAGFLASAAAALLVVVAGVLYVTVDMTLTPSRWLDALDALDASGAYDRAPTAIADQIVAWVDSRPADQPRTLGPLDRSDVRAIVVTLASPDWLRSEVAAVVPALVNSVTATGQVRAVVSLAALKARLTGPTLLGVVLDRIAMWPACTAAQLPQVLGAQPPRCRPAEVTRNQLAVVAAGLVSVVAAQLPATVDLATPGDEPGSGVLAAAGISDLLQVAGAARSTLPTVVAAVAVLLLLGALLPGGGPRSILRRLGTPIVVGGAMLLVLSLGVDTLLAAAVAAIRQELADGGMAPGLVSIVGSAALVMVDRAGWLLIGVAAPLALAGLLLLAATWVVPGRRAASRAR